MGKKETAHTYRMLLCSAYMYVSCSYVLQVNMILRHQRRFHPAI